MVQNPNCFFVGWLQARLRLARCSAVAKMQHTPSPFQSARNLHICCQQGGLKATDSSLDMQTNTITNLKDGADIWEQIRDEARLRSAAEPALSSFFHTSLLDHHNLGAAMSRILSLKLDSGAMPAINVQWVLQEAYAAEPALEAQAMRDLQAVKERDPACRYYSTPMLFYKGFQGLQAWRISNWCWGCERHSLALFLQSRISEVFGVDIHPAAQIGGGIMLDHATGIVIGETAVLGDDISIYHDVTLGWNGRDRGDRHPKVGNGVLLATGTKLLGNINIGEYARIAAGSIVLHSVKPRMTVAGVPAVEVSGPHVKPWWEETS